MLTRAQQLRRQIRTAELAAAGLPTNLAFYGPHADPRARALLQGGSGLGRHLGAAQGSSGHSSLAQALNTKAMGGPAGGKPNLTDTQAQAPHTAAATLAATTLGAADHTLTPAQQQARAFRQSRAEQMGLVQPGQAFHAYGPHKTQGADRLLALLARTGSGMTRGYGVAVNRRQAARSLANLLRQLG